MTVHHARVLALAAVLIGISALGPSTRLHAQKALAELRVLAEQGDAEAQYDLGFHFWVSDPGEAVTWYRLAADQGYAAAQTHLGLLYSIGQGVPQDFDEAIGWYRLAADQRDAAAQRGLGIAYAHGHGVPQDGAEARRWFELAADGNAFDQLVFGKYGLAPVPWTGTDLGLKRSAAAVSSRS